MFEYLNSVLFFLYHFSKYVYDNIVMSLKPLVLAIYPKILKLKIMKYIGINIAVYIMRDAKTREGLYEHQICRISKN